MTANKSYTQSFRCVSCYVSQTLDKLPRVFDILIFPLRKPLNFCSRN